MRESQNREYEESLRLDSEKEEKRRREEEEKQRLESLARDLERQERERVEAERREAERKARRSMSFELIFGDEINLGCSDFI